MKHLLTIALLALALPAFGQVTTNTYPIDVTLTSDQVSRLLAAKDIDGFQGNAVAYAESIATDALIERANKVDRDARVRASRGWQYLTTAQKVQVADWIDAQTPTNSVPER